MRDYPPLQEPRIPVISNVDAAPHADPAVIKAILAQQLTAPVQVHGVVGVHTASVAVPPPLLLLRLLFCSSFARTLSLRLPTRILLCCSGRPP